MRKRRPAVRKDEVQADAKIRQPLCAPDGVGRCGSGYHETGGGKNAGGRGLFDGIVDGFVQTEIVSRHYQIFLHRKR